MSKKNIMKGYNIALHGIRANEGSKEIAENIMEKGLNIATGRKSIRCTTVQLGDEYRNDNFKKDLEYNLRNYQFGGDSEGYTVIIATPAVLRNSRGEVMYLGDPYRSDKKQDKATSGQEYETTCILDIVCSNLGKIPSEFVYGYTKTGEIIRNPKHYSQQLNNNKIDSLFDMIKGSLTPTEFEISEKIAKENFEDLKFDKEIFKTYGLDELLNIIEYAEENYGDIENDEVEF